MADAPSSSGCPHTTSSVFSIKCISSVDNMAEADLMQMRPIGYLHSVFQFKNGTPRQPSLCSSARGWLTVEKTIFNNPEHALEGLEQFSHAWIVFVFHKNQPGHTKAKVKPPRLNGKRTGVFSTRSPYRPNAIGLTLARIERISGARVHLSGIDIIDGTPVLDIKPFIPQYDVPHCRTDLVIQDDQLAVADGNAAFTVDSDPQSSDMDVKTLPSHLQTSLFSQDFCSTVAKSEVVPGSAGAAEQQRCLAAAETGNAETESDFTQRDEATRKSGHVEASFLASQECVLKSCSQTEGPASASSSVVPGDTNTVRPSECDSVLRSGEERRLQLAANPQGQGKDDAEHSLGVSEGNCHVTEQKQASVILPPPYAQQRGFSSSNATVAQWLSSPPVAKLHVSFTPTAEGQLQKFKRANSSNTDPPYRLQYLCSAEDVRTAIVSMLAEDPRSVYRREKCCNSLYFFTVDQVHVTCWFDDKENRAEVVRLQPVSFVEKLLVKEM